jgi:hypothetical protein
MPRSAEWWRQQRAKAEASQRELYGPDKSRSVASRLYSHLESEGVRKQIKQQWSKERSQPTRRFTRKQFRRRGEEE